jgi:hypothetical protein
LATVACTGVVVHNFLKREQTRKRHRDKDRQRQRDRGRERERERDAPACETRGDGGGAGEDCFSPYLVTGVVARAVLLRGVLGRVITVLPSFAA